MDSKQDQHEAPFFSDSASKGQVLLYLIILLYAVIIMPLHAIIVVVYIPSTTTIQLIIFLKRLLRYKYGTNVITSS